MSGNEDSTDSGPGRNLARGFRKWLDRLWWLTLLGWLVPFLLGGWWWLLLILLVPAGMALMMQLVNKQEQEQASQRATAVADLAPGAVVDGAADQRRERLRPTGSPGSPPGSPPARSPGPPVVPVAVVGVGGAQVLTVAHNPQAPVLAVGRVGGRVELWTGIDTPDPSCRAVLAHGPSLTAVAYSPDGRLLVTAGAEGTVTVWDVQDPDRPVGLATVVHDGTGRFRAVQAVHVNVNGWLATGGADGLVRLWSLACAGYPALVATARLTRRRSVPRGTTPGVAAVAFSADGQLLAAGGRRGNGYPVRLWRLTGTGTVKVATLRPHRIHSQATDNPVCHALAFHPSCPLLVSASEYAYLVNMGEYAYYQPTMHDSAVVLWDLQEPTHPAGLVALTERGGDVVTARKGRPRRTTALTLAGHTQTPRQLSISPDGTRLATGADDGTVLVWDIVDPSAPRHLLTIPLDDPPGGLAFTTGERHLACGRGSEVTLWAVP